MAAFGADDSEDEKYDEADDAERKRDSSNEQRRSRVRIPFARDNYFFVDIVVEYLALDITANCFCKIIYLALDGFNLNTVNKLSSKEKKSRGCWAGSNSASTVLWSPTRELLESRNGIRSDSSSSMKLGPYW